MKFIANLNGTILCPYQILLDIAEQIPNSTTRINHLAFIPICELNSTNDWINLESLGKPVALRAKAICDTISASLQNEKITDLSLDVYIKGPLMSDNLFSLIFLADTLNSIELTFISTQENLACLKASTVHLFDKENISIQFKSDNNLDEPSASKQMLLKLKETRQQSIKQFGFSINDDALTQDQIPDSVINQLIGFSWVCLKSGGYDIACQLLEKIQSHHSTSDEMQEQLFMHLLMVRFFSHQYALIANSDFPEVFKTLGQPEVQTLQFLTAYSATLSRNLSVANKFFIKCNITEEMPLTDENSLYQLNLFALSKVLQGETDTAFKLEFRIKDYIKEQLIDTVGLKYVNFINIARLYKKTKDFDQSFNYYNQAYNEISGGGYTTSDHIYYNMNLGSLSEAAGDHEQALLYWIKTAAHWLACSNKYALSWRPRLILCQETLSDVTKPLPIEKANTFLFDKIKELIQTCALEISNTTRTEYQFVEDHFSIQKQHCFINNNIVLYSGTIESRFTPLKTTPSEQKLATLVSQCIYHMMDIPKDQNVFIIDTQLDIDFLNTAEEAMAFANFSNCPSCYFNGQWLKLENMNTLKAMNASLSKVIQTVTPTEKGLEVQYKRSFLNKTLLDQKEIDLVSQLKQTDMISIEHYPLDIVNQLAKKRILNFSYPN